MTEINDHNPICEWFQSQARHKMPAHRVPEGVGGGLKPPKRRDVGMGVTEGKKASDARGRVGKAAPTPRHCHTGEGLCGRACVDDAGVRRKRLVC
jgi:hypothetical protein